MTARLPRFDRVAHLYQPMEWLSFGPLLERCRFCFIPHLSSARQALVLGDGDGRFLARLLAAHSALCAHAVDLSPAMLRLLRRRAARVAAAARLTVTCADARSFRLPAAGYDLVATHFFLDCLTAEEAENLIVRLRPCLAPGARWVVSEFEIPAGHPLRAWISRGIIAFLYAAFRCLTGLAVRSIPPWRTSLTRAGFHPAATRSWLGGLLVAELWELPQATVSGIAGSHLAVPATASGPNPIPGIDPGPTPTPEPPPIPRPSPAPGPPPEPDPEPYPGPIPIPQPVTRVW